MLTGFDFKAIQNGLNSADKLISEEEYSQAEEIFDSAISNLKAITESNPEMEIVGKNLMIPQVYFKLGKLQYKQNKYEDAKEYFNEILNFEIRSTWDIQAIYYLGRSEFNQKNYNEARGHFSRLVDEHKDSKRP